MDDTATTVQAKRNIWVTGLGVGLVILACAGLYGAWTFFLGLDDTELGGWAWQAGKAIGSLLVALVAMPIGILVLNRR